MNAIATSKRGLTKASSIVTGTTVVVAVTFSGSVLLLLNEVGPESGVFIINQRAGLWLYLIEIILEIWFGRGHIASLMSSWSNNLSDSVAEQVAQAVWSTCAQVIRDLLWRIPAVFLGTALMFVWCGESYINCLAVAFPSLLAFILRRCPKVPPPQVVPVAPIIRGTHLGAHEDAHLRASELNELAPTELARKLLENYEPATRN